MLPEIRIFLRGGLVEEVRCTVPASVTVIDYDTQTIPPEQLTTTNAGEPACVETFLTT